MFRLVPLLLSLGCIAHAGIHHPSEPVTFPCEAEQARIQAATYPDAALAAVRGYLGCVTKLPSVPPGVPDTVRMELASNPYPDATGRVDVWAWFFDTEALKPIPNSPAAMRTTVLRLRDEALARRAMGQDDIAQAAEARAQRFQQLLDLLEELDG